MISKLTIFAPQTSYKSEVAISDLKKFNLFYGLNGAGKTVISQYLATFSEPSLVYSNCKIETSPSWPPPDILVYNEDFIQVNFWSKDTLKGIFTLDKTNVDAEKKIGEAKEEISKLTDDKSKQQQEIEKINQSRIKIKKNVSDKIWESKNHFESTNLKICMTGFMDSKEKFLEKIISTSQNTSAMKESNPDQELEQLSKEHAELISNRDQKKRLYNELQNTLLDSESNDIFNETIVGSEDNYLSKIISKLEHSDWIYQGINDYLDLTDNCPFCARHLDSDLKEKIKNVVDNTYKEKINEILKIEEAYKKNIETINGMLQILKVDMSLKDEHVLNAHISQLEAALKSNLELMSKKIKEPSQKVEITKTAIIIEEINAFLRGKNQDIVEFNKKIDNMENSITDIKRKFWLLLRMKYDTNISMFQEQSDDYSKRIKKINKDIKDIDVLIEAQKQIVSKQQALTKNIDTAIDNINRNLKSFGIDDFSIKRSNEAERSEPLYMIVRDSQSHDANTFKTLSEGEKTLITFLYFIETCIGVKDIDDPVVSQRIVVIDDPISSLSFNYVYDIACLIRELFLNPNTQFSQILILTHHLYFFHELYKGAGINKSDTNYYRIIKSDKTQVTPIGQKEIMNNYECFWQIIKDVARNNASPIILPNTMRNILEQFFSFIKKKESLSDALKKLSSDTSDQTLKSFERYIQRQSHSDSTNITDMKEVDVPKYLEYFKNVFEKTGYIDHYNDMMNE